MKALAELEPDRGLPVARPGVTWRLKSSSGAACSARPWWQQVTRGLQPRCDLAGSAVTRPIVPGSPQRAIVRVRATEASDELASADADCPDAPEAIAVMIGDQIEVLVDGGVRRGGDVAKALALGAKAVLIGRAYLWGVAANGQAGSRASWISSAPESTPQCSASSTNPSPSSARAIYSSPPVSPAYSDASEACRIRSRP